MFDKRLLSMVPGAVKFIVADVAFQWVALACNIALFMVIGLFLQATLEGAAEDPAVYRERQYDLLADTVRRSLDMQRIYDIMEGKA